MKYKPGITLRLLETAGFPLFVVSLLLVGYYTTSVSILIPFILVGFLGGIEVFTDLLISTYNYVRWGKK